MIFVIIGIVIALLALGYAIFERSLAVGAVGVLVAVLLTALGGVKSVPTGHTGIVTTFGRVEDYTLEAGVHWEKPWSSVIKIDNRVQKNTVEMSAFSSDIQEVSVVYTINYTIEKANAQNLYKSIGLKYFDTVIAPKVVENVKRVIAKYTAEALVSSRQEVAMAIEASLEQDLAKYNIELVATSIENLDFTDAFTDAVEAKQVAEQNKLKEQTIAETKVIQAQADADVRRIEAEAEANANELLSESLTDEILEELMIERWNGALPKVILGENGSSLGVLDLNPYVNEAN